MNTNLNNFLGSKEPPKDFEDKVLLALEQKGQSIYKRRLYSYSVFMFLSLLAIVPSTMLLVDDLAKSGFSKYLSLIISERTGLFLYLKEFTASLVESIPVFSLALVFLFLGAFVWSVVQVSGSVKGSRMIRKFAYNN